MDWFYVNEVPAEVWPAGTAYSETMDTSHMNPSRPMNTKCVASVCFSITGY